MRAKSHHDVLLWVICPTRKRGKDRNAEITGQIQDPEVNVAVSETSAQLRKVRLIEAV